MQKTPYLASLTAIASLAAACNGDIDEPVRCTDPLYGNGMCDLDTTCDAPDIDCLATFDTPEAAKSFYDAQSKIVAEKGVSMPITDARFGPMQSLLDEGWEAYKETHTVGDLASKRVQLVLVDNATPNAFVAPTADLKQAGLVVMVHKGIIDLGAPKDQLLGVVMHELEHAVGLHVIPAVKERMRTYYLAPANTEPLGFEQTDNPTVRAQFEAWFAHAEFAGYASDAELGGLPLLSSGGLGRFFKKLLEERSAVAGAACSAGIAAYNQVHAAAMAKRNPLDANITVTSTIATDAQAALTKLRDECFVGVTGNAITHLSRLAGVPESTLRPLVPADIVAAIETQSVIVGWYNWTLRLRTKMREVEAGFPTAAGAPWSRLRYFSTEEAADDSSASTLIALGLDPTGSGRLLISINPAEESACVPLLANPHTIPYGEDLVDDHHASCWRTGHLDLLADRIAERRLPKPTLGPASTRAQIFETLTSH